jgi:hypothetical protein
VVEKDEQLGGAKGAIGAGPVLTQRAQSKEGATQSVTLLVARRCLQDEVRDFVWEDWGTLQEGTLSLR